LYPRRFKTSAAMGEKKKYLRECQKKFFCMVWKETNPPPKYIT